MKKRMAVKFIVIVWCMKCFALVCIALKLIINSELKLFLTYLQMKMENLCFGKISTTFGNKVIFSLMIFAFLCPFWIIALGLRRTRSGTE